MATAGHGEVFFTERGKTGKPVGGLLSARTFANIVAYVETPGFELHDESQISEAVASFRQARAAVRAADALYRNSLVDDFAGLSRALLGPDEKRRLMDMRRSGAVEVIVGDAIPAALYHAMGNTLSASNTLFQTYVPVRAETILSVRDERLKGVPN